MSHHSDTHSSRSARSRRRRHHHARSHTTSSYITREPQPESQPEPEHFPIGHVWEILLRKYKSPKTKELTAGQREQKKPFSAVTVAVENLTSESYEEDDLSGIPDLVEAIKLQATGPAEAARSIRKKLKYGNVHRQLRALTILDGLIQNAGARFQRAFADEMLLERLRICGTSDLTDPLVRDKCKELFRSWAAEYKNVRGLEQIASLYKQLPRTKKVVTQDRSQVLRETEQNPFHVDEDEEPAPAPAPAPPTPQAGPSHSRQSSLTTSSRERAASLMSGTAKKAKKEKEQDKKRKHKPFNLAAEKETMKAAIAESSVASTNLLNALRHINREKERISENKAAQTHFDACKLLRRKILRYIQYVETEDWLGALLHANDELVTALMTFEQLDRSIDADSDSDDELAEQQHMYKLMTESRNSDTPTQQMSNLNLGPKSPLSPTFSAHRPAPPTPVQSHHQAAPEPEEEEEEEEEDENDPFADRNALDTPATEKQQPAW